MRNTIAVFTLLLVAMCLVVDAQDRAVGSGESARILSLENAWNQAEFKHDAQALRLLVMETFQYTDADGTFMDKDQWLASIKNEVDQYEQLVNRGMEVHVYGNAAVVTGQYIEKIKSKGKPAVHSGRFTDTWVKQNGEWKCAASQETLISH
jgi:ketosteroid isomerase-like protein